MSDMLEELMVQEFCGDLDGFQSKVMSLRADGDSMRSIASSWGWSRKKVHNAVQSIRKAWDRYSQK